jgi:hypothetical protein
VSPNIVRYRRPGSNSMRFYALRGLKFDLGGQRKSKARDHHGSAAAAHFQRAPIKPGIIDDNILHLVRHTALMCAPWANMRG